MNREIKFRAQRKLNGEWAYGSLVRNNSEDWDRIYLEEDYGDEVPQSVRVITRTIGQFTGLKDKNGVEIYEAEIMKCNDVYGVYHGVVEWWNDRWCLKYKGHRDGSDQYQSLMTVKGEVIGNIHQHPHLISSHE